MPGDIMRYRIFINWKRTFHVYVVGAHLNYTESIDFKSSGKSSKLSPDDILETVGRFPGRHV